MPDNSQKVQLDASQLAFCRAFDQNVRLLAPAGCGKTLSILYRCSELSRRAKKQVRFLLVTFTKVAAAELRSRLAQPQFSHLSNQLNVSTLNSFGYRRIRDRVRNHRLLTSRNDLHFAMLNQLKPVYQKFKHIEEAISGRSSSRPRGVMEVMDNFKSMGFNHITDKNRDLFDRRLATLREQGLSWRIEEQFDILTRLRILDPKAVRGDDETASESGRALYDRFFRFWRAACVALHEQSTFTLEDQKYFAYLDMVSPDPHGKPRVPVTGAARYDHILVDEFQDINPLDLYLIRAISERHRATLTIVGDDDQAIFEWRGAAPDFILYPEAHFQQSFVTHKLEVNYRSPEEIVSLSQNLIRRNVRREAKRVTAGGSAGHATVSQWETTNVADRMRKVTALVRETQPGRVAVIGRLKRQLIPFQIFYASDGAPFRTASDLDVFAGQALDGVVSLLENRQRFNDRAGAGRCVADILQVFDLIKRFPLNKKDRNNLRAHMMRSRPTMPMEALTSVTDYAGPALSGKQADDLFTAAAGFLTDESLPSAIAVLSGQFAGLSFDQEKAEADVWYTAPPLQQIADIAKAEQLTDFDLINRIEVAKQELEAYRGLDEETQVVDVRDLSERPLHLLTAHRAKGKEFETVVILDTDDRTWPHRAQDASPREIEGERRLFYVAFTRALQRVILLRQADVPPSRFVTELWNGDSDPSASGGEL